MINVTKNAETKIYEAIQELKSLAKQNDGKGRGSDRHKLQSNLNSLIENTLAED